MTLILTKDIHVALFSLLCSVSAFVITICYMPETLKERQPPPQIQNGNEQQQPNVDEEARRQRRPLLDDESDSSTLIVATTTVDMQHAPSRQNDDDANNHYWKWIWFSASRPIREISIIRRNKSLQMVSLGCFGAAMVFSIDATFVIYYIEQKFNVQKSDIAMMTLALGIAGIVIQGILVHPIVAGLGEKGALILAFSCGICHNFLYGYAKTKRAIYAALIISQLTKTNIPLLSSIASKLVAPTEQGRVQGAIFAITAIGNAVGPILVRFIYHHILPKLGPGSMFLYASILYVIGTIVVSFIPALSIESIPSTTSLRLEYEEESSLAEALIIVDDDNDEGDLGASVDPGTSQYDAI
jgi:Na+/melibiose symporter-like transporter